MSKDRVELKIYQDAMNGFLVDNPEKKQYTQLLAQYYLPFFADVHKAWVLQREGMFPEDMTLEDLEKQAHERPLLKRPYTALRCDEQGQLQERAYRDIPEFGKVLDSAGRYLRLARGYIEHPEPNPPFSEKNALIDNLLALDPAFPGGDFEPSRYALLNREVYPGLVIDAGLSDPYGPIGYKYWFQGWLMSQDPVQTQMLNLELIMALNKMREFLPDQQGGIDQLPGHRLLAGDVIVHAGLAALEEWRGNTMPSENSLRTGRRTTTYIFDNTLRERFDSHIFPALVKYFPGEFRDTPEWKAKAYRGIKRHLNNHEGIGHRLASVGEAAEIGRYFMTLKESQSDALAQIANFRSATVPLDVRRASLVGSLGWRMADIDAFDPRTQKGMAHTVGGMMRINALDEAGAIEIDRHTGVVRDVSLKGSHEADVAYVRELSDVAAQGANNPKFIAEYIDYRANNPIRYLQPDGGSPDDYPSSQRLAA